MPQQQQVDPLQQFIQNHMAFQEYTDRQKAIGAQLVLQRQAQENAELSQFVDIAQKAQNPRELQSLAAVFSARNPSLAPAFEGLMQNILPSQQTQTEGLLAKGVSTQSPDALEGLGRSAVLKMATGQTEGQRAADQALARLAPAELTRGAAIGIGTALSAPQQAQLGESQADRAQRASQFAVEAGQRETGFNLQRAQLAQQGQIAQQQLLEQGGMLPLAQQAQLQARNLEIQKQLSQPFLPPQQRMELAQELSDNRATMQTLQTIMSAQLSRGGSSGHLGVAQLPGLIETQRNLLVAAGKAKTDAERQAIKQNYDAVTQIIRGIAPQTAVEPLGDTRSVGETVGDFIRGMLTHPLSATGGQ